MATDKKSFILYCDLIHTVKKMSKEKAGELFLTILSYVNDENPIVDDVVVDLVFEPIKQQLKRDLKDWERTRKKRAEAGRKGGKAKLSRVKPGLTKSSKSKPSEASQAVNVTDTVNVIGNVTLSETTLEAAERNQFTHTGERNTEFVKAQWEIFLLERKNDPSHKQRENAGRMGEYFLNWVRTKFPKKQNQAAAVSSRPVLSAKEKRAQTIQNKIHG